jgi:hypothetical protein
MEGNRVHILLVIARPYQGDVRFRSVARRLVEMAARGEGPGQTARPSGWNYSNPVPVGPGTKERAETGARLL